MLQLLSKTAMLKDPVKVKVKGKNATSAVESFHSIRLRYAPKRKFFTKEGQETKTMLAILCWNTMQQAELDGERALRGEYKSKSKARGEERKVKRKEIAEQPWMRQLVVRSIERKERQMSGDEEPEDEEMGSGSQEEEEDEPTIGLMLRALADEDPDEDESGDEGEIMEP